MRHQNPYAADAVDQASLPVPRRAQITDQTSTDFYVDGKTIECGSSVVLPEICVRTGETENLVEVRKTLSYTSPWAFLLGGAFLAVALAKECKVVYFLAAETKQRHRRRTKFGIAGIVTGIVLLIGGTTFKASSLVVVGSMILALAVLILLVAQPSLKAVRHKKGRFWLSGFQPLFFEELRALYADEGDEYV